MKKFLLYAAMSLVGAEAMAEPTHPLVEIGREEIIASGVLVDAELNPFGIKVADFQLVNGSQTVDVIFDKRLMETAHALLHKQVIVRGFSGKRLIQNPPISYPVLYVTAIESNEELIHY
jgi:hypothetical protein